MFGGHVVNLNSLSSEDDDDEDDSSVDYHGSFFYSVRHTELTQ